MNSVPPAGPTRIPAITTIEVGWRRRRDGFNSDPTEPPSTFLSDDWAHLDETTSRAEAVGDSRRVLDEARVPARLPLRAHGAGAHPPPLPPDPPWQAPSAIRLHLPQPPNPRLPPRGALRSVRSTSSPIPLPPSPNLCLSPCV